MSGPVACGLLSGLVCLQVPTQQTVFIGVCAGQGWCLCVYLPVNADVPPRAHGVSSVCAWVAEPVDQCALVGREGACE